MFFVLVWKGRTLSTIGTFTRIKAEVEAAYWRGYGFSAVLSKVS